MEYLLCARLNARFYSEYNMMSGLAALTTEKNSEEL